MKNFFDLREAKATYCGRCGTTHVPPSKGGSCPALSKKESVDEKTLTPAEKKKREEIAKAMERENPGMDKSKKMAIATATAKRVAEATIGEAFGQGQQVNLKNIETSMRKALKDKGNYKDGKVLWNFIDADVYMDIKPGRGQVNGFYKLFDRAADKLSKEMNLGEQTEIDEAKKEYGPGHIGAIQKMLDKEREAKKAKDAMKKEEAEQIDELSKKTLGSYIKKASDDRAKNAYDIGKSGKINYKGLKRRQGINKAVNKMAQ